MIQTKYLNINYLKLHAIISREDNNNIISVSHLSTDS